MPDRTRCGRALCAALFALGAAALLGCGPSDPLENVRRMQDTDGDFAASIEPLRALLEERPDDAEVSYRYGVALVATGQPQVSKWSLRKAMESEEWFEKSSSMLTRALLATGDHDKADEVSIPLL